MKYLKGIGIITIILLILTSCGKEEGESNNQKLAGIDTIINKDINIIISQDLSNRITLYPKPIDDTDIINSILEMYYPSIYKSEGRVIGQKDRISMLFMNSIIIKKNNIDMKKLNIDLSSFSNEERIKYLTNKTDDGNSYKMDKKDFLEEVWKINNSAKKTPSGADIRYLFESGLNELSVIKNPENKISFGKTIVNEKRNILILLTDGYMESGSVAKSSVKNKYYYLTKKVVNDFRKAFLASGESDIKDFFKANGYGIIPVKNSNLENLEVLAVEFYDRSIAKSGSTRIIPRDYEILKLFWEDWMNKSGLKRFVVYETFSSKSSFEAALKKFINSK